MEEIINNQLTIDGAKETLKIFNDLSDVKEKLDKLNENLKELGASPEFVEVVEEVLKKFRKAMTEIIDDITKPVERLNNLAKTLEEAGK